MRPGRSRTQILIEAFYGVRDLPSQWNNVGLGEYSARLINGERTGMRAGKVSVNLEIRPRHRLGRKPMLERTAHQQTIQRVYMAHSLDRLVDATHN